MRWTIFTLWQREPGEENKEFVQTCRVTTPNGKVSLNAVIEFTMTHRYQRTTLNIDSFFPVTEPGDYLLELFLMEKAVTQEKKFADYPIAITLVAPKLRELKA